MATATKTFQVPLPDKATDVQVAATDVVMHDEYVKTIARMA